MCSNRTEEVSGLQTYIEDVDNEITMILQSLQWDRSTLVSAKPTVACAYNTTHLLPPDKKETHDVQCWLKSQGYTSEDTMLPEPLDSNADTIVKLCPEDIKLIVESASKNDPNFKKGSGWSVPVPLTLERIQATYTVDERRAIHDAVVASVPACHDLSDLALLDANAVKSESKTKSRMEILAELRDMKRRRTKYRVAPKTKKYSDVLRDVIKTQMELYTDTRTDSGYNSDLNPRHDNSLQTANENPHHQTRINSYIKREKSSSIERKRTDGRKQNEYQRKRNDHDLRESRSYYHGERQPSNGKELHESINRDKRDVSFSNDRRKRPRKEKDDYSREKTRLSERKDRSEHEEGNEERSNNKRSYIERSENEHTERRSSRRNKYDDREREKYSRDYDERVKRYDGAGRQSNDKYSRDRHRYDIHRRDKRYENLNRSKHEYDSREYYEEKRYRKSDEIKIKQEVDEDPYDGYRGGMGVKREKNYDSKE